MKDIQNQFDDRNIPINKAGVKDISYPISLLTKDGGEQSTVGTVNMYVDLPRHFKGVHMSRFVEILQNNYKKISTHKAVDILKKMLDSLNAKSAHLYLEFPFFLNKKAPVSKTEGMMEYICSFETSINENKHDFVLGVKVPITSLCPCSKEISKFGAHNQRSIATINVRYNKLVWLEELIDIAENAASCPVYPVLKRSDEKYVTEKAYKNPKFVEDIVREIAGQLDKDNRISYYKASSENFESIHNHNAYACIERTKNEDHQKILF